MTEQSVLRSLDMNDKVLEDVEDGEIAKTPEPGVDDRFDGVVDATSAKKRRQLVSK